MGLQKSDKNILSGNLFVGILQFAFPVFLTTLVQTLFTAVDTAVVGNFADTFAVASIGVSKPIINLMTNFFIAIANGSGILIAKAIGAGNKEHVKKSVDSALTLSILLGLSFLLIAQVCAVPLLKAMDCPEECFEAASAYLRIYMLGAPAVMIYNFSSAIIRAEGDSTRPMYYITISGIVNIIVKISLCLVMANSVAAVAITTVLTQMISATLAMRRLMTKKDGFCKFNIHQVSVDRKIIGNIFRYGIPMAITASIIPFSSLQVLAATNSYGATPLAGITAANNIDSFVSALHQAFNTTCGTFVSQNVGAKNKKRTTKAIWICLLSGLCAAFTLGMLATYVIPKFLLGLFVPGNAEAIAYGQLKMQYCTATLFISVFFSCLHAATQAVGYPTFPVVNNLVSALGFRFVWMNFVYPSMPSLEMVLLSHPLSWSLSSTISIIFFLFAYRRHWKKVDLQTVSNQ